MVAIDDQNLSSEEITLNSIGETNDEANSSFEISNRVKLRPDEMLREAEEIAFEAQGGSEKIAQIIVEEVRAKSTVKERIDKLDINSMLRLLKVSNERFWQETMRRKELLEDNYRLCPDEEDMADDETEAAGVAQLPVYLSFRKRVHGSRRKQSTVKAKGKENGETNNLLKRLLKSDKEKIEASLFLRSGKAINHENNKKLFKELRLCPTKAGRKEIAQKFLKNITRNFGETLSNLRNQQLKLVFSKPHQKMNQLLINCLTKPDVDELGIFNPKEFTEQFHKTAQMMQGPMYELLNAFSAVQN